MVTAVSRTLMPTIIGDYFNSRCPTGKCTILTIYYNNNNNHNSSENNVNNNFKGNDHHLLLHFRADYNSALTGSKPNNATEHNAKNDTLVNSNNKRPKKADNNSISNNNPCADSEDNNDNNTDGNFKERERESDIEKMDEMEAKCDRQWGIFDFLATTNPFSFKLQPIFKFITNTTISDHVILYTR